MSARSPGVELGVVVALPAEAAGFGLGRARAGEHDSFEWGVVAIAGLGFESANAAAERLVERGVRALLSWGLAGGLASDLAPGDLLLPESVTAADGVWITDAPLRRAMRRVITGRQREGGSLYCSRTPVTSIADKQTLAARGMLAVDMESAAVAMVAQRANLPFVAVKAICDPASREIPGFALGLLDAHGSVRWSGIPVVLRAGPRGWHELNVLRRDFAAARGSLARAAHGLSRYAGS